MMKLIKNRFFQSAILIGISIGAYLIWRLNYYVPDYQLETLALTISSEDFEKLTQLKDAAREKGFLERSEDDYVSAGVKYQSQFRHAKVRLKGDWIDHLGHNKWSFRIKLEEPMEDKLKIFSVQNPKSREFLNGYVFHKLLKQEGILTNEFRFIHLKVNDESWGVYCLEEHLTNRLITSQGKPPGVIHKFSDNGYFQIAHDEDANTDGLIKAAKIKSYGGANDGSDNTERYNAESIMLNYQQQNDTTFYFFDSLQTAKYYALCDLTSAYHAMGWINVRFYYNYSSLKMEPMGYDPYPTLDWGKPYLGKHVNNVNNNPFETSMIIYKALKNDGIKKAYESELLRITEPDFIDQFMAVNLKDLEFLESEIQKEYSDYSYDYDQLKNRAKEIRLAISKN